MSAANSHWSRLIKASADSKRAQSFWELLKETSVGPKLDKFSAEQIRVLVALFSGSQAMSNLLVANPEWLESLDVEHIHFPRRAQGLRAEVKEFLQPLLEAKDYEQALSAIRRFKQREMLRIAARDLARLSNVSEITREISDVADVCLDAVLRVCLDQFTARYGRPHHEVTEGDWQPTPFCVLGMGKLGGQELNYSSDVDVLFVYGDEGQVMREIRNPKSEIRSKSAIGNRQSAIGISNHQFFCRLGEAFIGEVSRATEDGFLFRIDLRLRPEGDAGPLARSLGSYENYYAQWGQTWERMMLIKARGVAGNLDLAGEFLETIQAFRFPRSTGSGVLQEIAAMKQRIEVEIVGEEELERNVKLGRGGIREIEFIVQSLQLLHAGRQPFLQITQTLPCLSKLAQYKLLKDEQAKQLGEAYCFLRDVEHRLQMEENLQTHTIPSDREARTRLAKLMGFPALKGFETALAAHARNVRAIYDSIFKEEKVEKASPFPAKFEGAESEWKSLLSAHRFRDVDSAFEMLKEFVEGPGYVHVSPRTTQLARALLPKMFAFLPAAGRKSAGRTTGTPILSDPDRVVTRLDSFISAYGARSTLFEVWNSNPAIFELLLLLFDRSEFLAEVAIRTPDLVDDLVTSGWLRRKKTADAILDDLRHGAADEDQFAWLRRYHEAEFMRVGLRDILGLSDFEQSAEELSALADACLQYAVEVVMRRNKLKKPPFVVIGLGKLGGREITYGSDLDVIFVADAKAKELPRLQKLANETMDLLSRRTEAGMVFVTDARLRPDGEKGLLVNSLDAYEDYYRERAQLWEIQSLTRTRPVAGDSRLGERFQEMAAQITDFSAKRNAESQKSLSHVACYMDDWKKEIHRMRMRIEKERTPKGQDELAIKTGGGGLMDAEFIAQALCLEHGWHEANTLRALERGRESGAMPDAEKLIKNYRELRRLESILRRWSYEGETVLPDDPAPYYRVSVRCGFESPEAFREALAGWRRAIREVYAKVFPV